MVLLFVVSAEDDISGGDLKPLGGKTHVSNFNETITRSWCTFRSPNSPLEPKMKKYIFTERNGIYIIDLQKQLRK